MTTSCEETAVSCEESNVGAVSLIELQDTNRSKTTKITGFVFINVVSSNA
jgi:hypothetical protein